MFVLEFLCSSPAEPPVQRLKGLAWLESHWGLQNVAETSTREKKPHTRRVGELRFIMPAGPEELTLQALRPKQRGYRVFIDRQRATLAANRLV